MKYGKGVECRFDVWKTINLGIGLGTAEYFRRAFRDGEFMLSDWASDILGRPAFTAVAKRTEVDLIKVTTKELGFKDGARCDQIYKRAKEFGLELCPSEVGPQLRLQYQNQPNGEWIIVAMDPIFVSGSDSGLFIVMRSNSGKWLLFSRWNGPDRFWSPVFPWVFCRPRK